MFPITFLTCDDLVVSDGASIDISDGGAVLWTWVTGMSGSDRGLGEVD